MAKKATKTTAKAAAKPGAGAVVALHAKPVSLSLREMTRLKALYGAAQRGDDAEFVKIRDKT